MNVKGWIASWWWAALIGIAKLRHYIEDSDGSNGYLRIKDALINAFLKIWSVLLNVGLGY